MSRAPSSCATSSHRTRWTAFYNKALGVWMVERYTRVAGCHDREVYAVDNRAETHTTERRALARANMLNKAEAEGAG